MHGGRRFQVATQGKTAVIREYDPEDGALMSFVDATFLDGKLSRPNSCNGEIPEGLLEAAEAAIRHG